MDQSDVSNSRNFTTQIDPNILAAIRDLADKEGTQVQTLVDEALADLIETHQTNRPRPHVVNAYLASHDQFAELYKKLAQ